MGYISFESRNDLIVFKEFFTEKEYDSFLIYGHLLMKKFLLILKRDECDIIEYDTGENSYGNFVFLRMRYKGIVIHGWGFGIHEYRKKYLDYLDIDYFNFDNKDYGDEPPIELSKEELIIELSERETKLKEEAKKYYKEDETSSLFGELADMGDDDGALALMEDYGLL